MQQTACRCWNKGVNANYNLRFLKMLIVLLLSAAISAQAQTAGKTISLSVKNATLKEVLDKVNKQTGVFFLAPRNLYNDAKPVTLTVANVSLNAFLNQVLANQPINWRMEDNTIFLSAKKVNREQQKEPGVKGGSLKDSVISVYGTITADGAPVAGVSMKIKNQVKGTITNDAGVYFLADVPLNSVLAISCMGFKPREIPMSDNGMLNIELERTMNSLDETVVIAYGTTTKRFATGNVVSVKAAEIQKQPIQNPLLALQGRVPGMVISQQSGYDRGAVKIEIRGRNSLNPFITGDPLILVDGVALTVLDLTSNAVYAPGETAVSRGMDQTRQSQGSGGISPLYNFNPSDIESIDVLKDADATAIYGSRGANGVILITTKKGKPGKTSFNLDFSQGVSFITRQWDMLNTQQYIAMRKEAFKNDGLTPSPQPGSPGYAPDLFVLDSTRYTNWQKYIWGRTGNWMNAQTSVSGGTQQTTFRLSGAYGRTSDITTHSGANQKASVGYSITNQSKDQRFMMTFNGSYNFSSANTINIGLGPQATSLPPNAPSIFNEQGNLNYKEWKAAGLTMPFSGLLTPNDSKSKSLYSSLALQYKLYKGLELKVNLGYNNLSNTQTILTPIASQDPYTTTKRSGTRNLGNSTSTNWSVEPQLAYNGQIKRKGELTILAGATLQNAITGATSTTGYGFVNDALLGSFANAASINVADNYAEYKYAGVFGRIFLNWDKKYVINLNARRDGSSRFGPGNQFGNFGSVGGAWIMSQESWMKQFLPAFFSLIKLRGSYGTAGSDPSSDYKFLTQWGNTDPYLLSYNGVVPLSSQLQFNPNFHWEVNRQAEVAVDMGFFDERLTLNVSRYYKQSYDQLVDYLTPNYTGFSSVLANLPAKVQNKGWEGILTFQVFGETGFSWNTGFNISKNVNKLLSYPKLDESPYRSRYIVGEPISQTYLFHLKGIDPATGKYQYEDINHDGSIKRVEGVIPGTAGDDRYIRMQTVPDFTGGFNNQFAYKNLSLSIMTEFQKKVGLNATGPTLVSIGNMPLWSYENRWTTPGQQSKAPALSAKYDPDIYNYSYSDGGYTDASYIRIKTVALSYNLPKQLLKRIKMERLAINVNAQNLFTITKYKGLDPDVTSFGSMPPVRTITAGFSSTF
ncbi:SusC/RagA family TonB-linked outer membrane protein [Chitinophaga arvensicola]|uniref:TonB-linked outer membrane protein, SusC/RagA family n=1 Tax=Chitinophaga arvensicola TaxID=29529 RepID=A0A1I0RV49_9BACT|nr:SusC/RagA family TonB-linked outer membrane protein [Chitinophaga arvensicola]SEW45386.1 TonB-linked outer membrane protein, SusC/RagA family [Chitinophaga arvensicola]